MSGTEPNTKNKLRAACDRCHELKNRCMRTRGPDARCDRCERLDIDCVYGVGARMGRPRIQRADKGKSGSKRSTAGDSSKKSSSKRKAEGPERQEEGEPDRKEQIEKIQETEHYVFDSSHSMIHLTDPSLLPEGMPTHDATGMHYFSPDLPYLPTGNPTAEQDDYLFYSMFPDPVQQHEESDAASFLFDSASLDSIEKPFSMEMGSNELLQLQCDLHGLMLRQSKREISNDRAIEEVLLACNRLLRLFESFAAAGQAPDHSTLGFEGEILDQTNSLGQSPLAGLQVVTCYAYALHLLDGAVDTLECRSTNMPLVSIGTFNLSTQPNMSTFVVAHMLLKMMYQLREGVSALSFGSGISMPPSPQTTPETLGQGMSLGSPQESFSKIKEKERMMIEKVSRFFNGV